MIPLSREVPRQRRFGETTRRDAWWVVPALTFLGLGAFVVYATWAAFQGNHYAYGNYLSPFYSPELFGDSPHSWFGPAPSFWPAALPFSPALLILWAPGGFRFTCYYYRGAYYKAFFLTPPSCAVGGAPRRYRGERALFLFQNLHRYTLYCALVLLVCLWWEAGSAFFLDGRPGVGVGTVMMVINAALLSAYAFGCHSWRHLIGGRADCFSCGGSGSTRYGVWKGSSWLNERHMLFAWCSLVWVACTDLYIYLLSTGTVHDLSTW